MREGVSNVATLKPCNNLASFRPVFGANDLQISIYYSYQTQEGRISQTSGAAKLAVDGGFYFQSLHPAILLYMTPSNTIPKGIHGPSLLQHSLLAASTPLSASTTFEPDVLVRKLIPLNYGQSYTPSSGRDASGNTTELLSLKFQ